MPDCDNPQLCPIAQTKFNEMDLRWQEKFDSLQRSIDKSEQMLGIRLEEMNNFRKQIERERKDFTTRRETVLLNLVVCIAIAAVTLLITNMFGK